MSAKIMNSKKAQEYYPRPQYGSVSPVLVIGIGLFCLRYLLKPVFGITAPDFINVILSGSGILFILVGGAMSIFKSLN